MEMNSLKSRAVSCLNVVLRVPFVFVLQAPLYNVASSWWHEHYLSGTVLRVVGYFAGLCGLFLTFDRLLLFYYWIFQLLLLLVMYFVIGINQDGQSDSSTSNEPAPVNSQLMSDSLPDLHNIYAHVIAVTSIAAACYQKWSETCANGWETVLIFILPFGLQRLLAPYAQTPDSCLGLLYLACLCVLSIFTLRRVIFAVTMALKLLDKTIHWVCRTVNALGWLPVIVYHWQRVSMSHLLFVSWLTKFLLKMVVHYLVTEVVINWVVIASNLCECCVSYIDLISVSVMMANVSKYILWLVRLCVRESTPGQQHGNQHSDGWNLGLVFFLLGLQCGLTEAKSAERFLMIGLILVIVLALLVQSAFEIVEPSLATLGAIYTGILNSYHIRVLTVSLLLLLMSFCKVWLLLGIFQLDPWFIALVFSDIDNIVRIIGALAVYVLFVVNVHLKSQWEELDDYIYYIKAMCKVFEFLVAVLAVVLCVLAAFAGHWNLMGAALISMHAYFNVYKRAQEGWKNFLLRRNAVTRLNSLEWATEEQLNQLSDVCAICFDELKSARVTQCSHFFHSNCLRKWLYVQNKCPLCHLDIILPED